MNPDRKLRTVANDRSRLFSRAALWGKRQLPLFGSRKRGYRGKYRLGYISLANNARSRIANWWSFAKAETLSDKTERTVLGRNDETPRLLLANPIRYRRYLSHFRPVEISISTSTWKIGYLSGGWKDLARLLQDVLTARSLRDTRRSRGSKLRGNVHASSSVLWRVLTCVKEIPM